jgi:phage shock protein A
MSVFKRLFKLGEAELSAALDKLEDPIKVTEQGIRDLKNDLDDSLKALAEVKALSIRARNDMEKYQLAAKDYENKAMLLLEKGEKQEISGEEADRLATESLKRKKENEDLAAQSQGNQQQYEKSLMQLEQNVKVIKSNVSKWENELKTLKARVKVSSATKNINKQMAQIDSTDTVSMLEKMKDKVQTEEALAEAYGDIANESKSTDAEIDKALEGTEENTALADLKRKMGLNQ